MSQYKQCPNGHYYSVEYNESPSTPPARTKRESLSELATPQEEMVPRCRYCGHLLRNSIPAYNGYIYDVKEKVRLTPWNYFWNGKCENCGHDYNIHIVVPIEQGKNKETSVYADRCGIATYAPDEYTVLSGVTIKTEVEGKCNEVFLSAKELRYLVNALKNSPLLEQYDYFHDDT